MAPTITPPLNTMLADLDESLRGLLKRDLARHGFDGVEIVFDAPTKEWAASLSAPTVNLFLYDIRESTENRLHEWNQQQANGNAVDVRPPLRVDASYAVTAWTRAVEDEHRLLSQVLGILYAYTELPADVLAGALTNGTQPYPLETRIVQERSDDKADFWTSIGGQYKASLDYVVLVSCDAGTVVERGPEVRTQRLLLGDSARPRRYMEEFHRIGGTVVDADGAPVPNAWVALPDLGMWAASNSAGRFRFDRIEPGTYSCIARTAAGGEASGEVEVPGRGVDLVVKAAKAAAKRKS
jgi:Pvc16 N-terminal domain/Carboxypeptidase regulatory-like domain